MERKKDTMRRSHLETYVEIISLLVQQGPLIQTQIAQKTNLNFDMTRHDLRFLAKQSLVEKRTIGKDRTVFAVTQRGINVLKYFKEPQHTMPIAKKAQKIRCTL